MKFKILKFALGLACALMLGACDGEKRHLALNGESIATKFDPKTRSFIVGENDKPVILFFFTASCGACGAQTPILNEIHASQKALVIGVLGGGGELEIDLKTAREKGVKFPTLSAPASVKYLSNVAGGIFGTPTSLIYDKNGKMVKKLIGLYPKSAFENEI
ncbi:TlpA family protein disulfide reductase [Campylobacter sp. JMF_06 NA1]|uniref:TlpA family protein disulfide reductase n=1 Tax=Campylobacter sp. JMF_06 NA1 TaxID=2983823 RepID=UPI0022E9ADA3|nr:TlpA family protein disulfide reductase [Campylobacter sp. JMF_06 NA1]MDA3078680.1 TlpA family protein disulfide reductase [Campylobacter sp. JMF_06 NA1]